MQVTIKVQGLEELKSKLQGLQPILDDEMETAMNNSLLHVERSAVENVSHLPPEHPQIQTGNLKESIMSEWYWTSDVLQGDCGTNVIYGPYLEYGWAPRTRIVSYLGVNHYLGKSFVGPYPWLEPALMENLDNIQDEFEDAVSRAVNRASITS